MPPAHVPPARDNDSSNTEDDLIEAHTLVAPILTDEIDEENLAYNLACFYVTVGQALQQPSLEDTIGNRLIEIAFPRVPQTRRSDMAYRDCYEKALFYLSHEAEKGQSLADWARIDPSLSALRNDAKYRDRFYALFGGKPDTAKPSAPYAKKQQ
jgi:hypothetical protein